jgi:hypothetical protein
MNLQSDAAGFEVFDKPAADSWTAPFRLDTGPVSIGDSLDPEFCEFEIEEGET